RFSRDWSSDVCSSDLDDAKTCYETTLSTINKAIQWLDAQTAGKPAFGGAAFQSLSAPQRRAIVARLMPEIRGLIGQNERKLGHRSEERRVGEGSRAR